MPSTAAKTIARTRPGSTGKGSKANNRMPAFGSPRWVAQVAQNRTDASRRAGRDTAINWD